jgi:hypothetical protein
MRFALYPRKSLAKEANIARTPPSSTEFSIGHNVNTKKEVNSVMARAKKAGAKIIKPAQNTFWGNFFAISAPICPATLPATSGLVGWADPSTETASFSKPDLSPEASA